MQASPRIAQQDTNILVLEDNPADFRLLQLRLEECVDRNYVVDWSQTVGDARARLLADPRKYVAVFVDQNLPDGLGTDLIKEVAAGLTAPMILLTGEDCQNVDDDAMAHGASHFLVKDRADSQALDRVIRYSVSERAAATLKLQDLTVSNAELHKQNQEREAEAANVIKLTEHLAQPSDTIEFGSHIVDRDGSQYEAVLSATNVGVWRIRTDGVTISANALICHLFRNDDDDTIQGIRFVDQFAAPFRNTAEKELRGWSAGLLTSFEARFDSARGGRDRQMAISGCPIVGEDGNVGHIIVTVVDVTERREAEAAVRNLARHDQLTGLLNRNTFLEVLEKVAALNWRNGRQMALVYLDLDKFKQVNDTLGHAAGDEVLKEASRRIKNCVRESDLVARIGGDEFTMALNGLNRIEDAEPIAQKMLDALAAPMRLGDQSISIGASIGIALFLEDTTSADECLRNADAALYHCKRNGANSYAIFDGAIMEASETRRRLEAELRSAIDQGEFRMHYQRQVGLGAGATTGYEALIRWESPSRGLLAPGAFIGAAEENGDIVDIGAWAIRQVASDIRDHLSGENVSINVSAKELRNPNLIANLRAAIEEFDVDPARLTIEVTESSVIEDMAKSAKTIEAIRSAGARVALDDFGTGYSSLALLKQLPVDCIKIDGSFVQEMLSCEADKAIVEAIINLGAKMGMRVVAECIETVEQAEALRELGCPEAQGYFFGRPEAIEAAAD